MKKYVALTCFVFVLAAGFLCLPAVIDRLIPAVTVTYPVQTRFSDKAYVSGRVEEAVKTDVTVELPLVPKQVCVMVGDEVEANGLLATVDIAATRDAILSLLSNLDGISEETLSVFQSLAGLDGLTAQTDGGVLSGGMQELAQRLQDGLDETMLDALLPSQIRSPASGTVTSLNLTPGSLVMPSSPLATVSRTEELQVKMTVPETEAQEIAEGDPVLFTAAATGDQTYTGVVSRIFPTATQTLVGTSQQTVVGFYVTPTGNTGNLKPGYSVDGIIRTGEEEVGLVVPYEAIRQDETNQEYVYVVEGSRAVRRNIRVGKELSGGAVVIEGLSYDDAVVEEAEKIEADGGLVRIEAS